MGSFNEHSIYNLLTIEESKERKPKRYVSKNRQSVKEEYAAGREGNKTMGPSKVIPPHPGNYLIKHSKEPKLNTDKSFHYPDEHRAKPPIPKKNNVPLMGLKTTKNLICTNIGKNATSLPKIPAKRFADTRHGDTHDLVPSGCEPVFVHKRDFGEVPVYITRRKEQLQRAQDEYDQYVAESFKKGALRQLTEEEHAAILDGLKTNWEDLHDRYQSLPMIIDTFGRKQRKERMDAQMKQLERDIELLEKHKIVYTGN